MHYKLNYDVFIVGAGAGGIGAAVGAARKGATVLLIDSAQLPGGVVASAWVHNWEPTCGNSPFTRELWNRMRAMPNGATDMPFTTSRNGTDGHRNPTMPFELWAYQKAVNDIFAELPNLTFMGNTMFISAKTNGRLITSVTISHYGCSMQIYPRCVIDASGCLVVARACGCPVMLGTDSKADFGEEAAPEKADRHNLNKVNWIYRVKPNTSPKLDMSIDDIPPQARIDLFFQVDLPCGDHLINICGHGNYSPEIDGDLQRASTEQFNLAYLSYCWQVVSGHHPDWSLVGMAPALGIRESYRLKARKIFTLNDIISNNGKHSDRAIAQTDHPLDVHGMNLEHLHGIGAYEIPYECTLPQEFDNLWIGSRGIGATHIVSGSCRLSRTIMTLGEAVGKAAAIAAARNVPSGDINPTEIADFE